MLSTSLINHINMTMNTTTTTTRKPLYIQGQELIHNSLNKLDRGTLTSGTIVIVTLTCLILIFISVKTFM